MSATAEAPAKPLMKFRLHAGTHEQAKPGDPKTTEHFQVLPNQPLPIIESEIDLAARFNVPGYAPRYERIINDEPQVIHRQKTVLVDLAALEKKPINEVVGFAQDNEIDVTGLKDKKQVIDAIKTALMA